MKTLPFRGSLTLLVLVPSYGNLLLTRGLGQHPQISTVCTLLSLESTISERTVSFNDLLVLVTSPCSHSQGPTEVDCVKEQFSSSHIVVTFLSVCLGSASVWIMCCLLGYSVWYFPRTLRTLPTTIYRLFGSPCAVSIKSMSQNKIMSLFECFLWSIISKLSIMSWACTWYFYNHKNYSSLF